jgi:hypothetical protein
LRLTCGYLNFRIARARRGLTVCRFGLSGAGSAAKQQE